MAERPQDGPRARYRARLPGFIREEPVGLGDVIKHATSNIGMRPCGGCAERAAKLNRWVEFTGRTGGRPR